MRRLTIAASAALCLMGTSSLALAEEGTKYGDQMETGKLSQEPSVLGNKREPVRAKDATKREPVPDDAMKGEKGNMKDETKGKTKEHKGKKKEHKEKKAHKDATKDAPAAPAPAAPAPPAAP
jgi:hypothetical protein